MHSEGGHGINDCKFPPSVQEQAGLDRSIWDTHWDGAGPSGKDAFLAKQAARQQGTVPGATYVTTSSSQPYTRPGVPRPVHVLSRFGPGLHAISVTDTSRESLTTIADLASSMRTQTESMSAMQLQMDHMDHIHHPPTAAPYHVRTQGLGQRCKGGLDFRRRAGGKCEGRCGARQRDQTLLLSFGLGASDNAP